MSIKKLYLDGHESKLSKTVLDDEVTKCLLPDVTVDDEGKIPSVNSEGSWVLTSVGAASIIPITYSELVALRDASSLAPGQQYRITDYECTVAHDEYARAVAHPYDIIVIADTSSQLNENARACSRPDDNYYTDITAWQLKYCLDNDVQKFGWADEASGKGVVYYLKDGYNNEAHYDFKQIQFKKSVIAQSSYGQLDDCVADPQVDVLEGIVLSDTVQWLYTFDLKLDGEHVDASTTPVSDWDVPSICFNNSIGCLVTWPPESSEMQLPHNTVGYDGYYPIHNVVFCDDASFNTVNGGYDIFLASNCAGNVLGNYVHSIHLGTGSSRNVLCSQVRAIDMGSDCIENAIDTGGYHTLGHACTHNMIRGYRNTFDGWATDNVLSIQCEDNHFGHYCVGIQLGAACKGNRFESTCSNIVLGSWCIDNQFGQGCTNISFYKSQSSQTLQNNFSNNVVDAGCSNLRLYGGSAGGRDQMQNYHILSGVSGQPSELLSIELVGNREYCTFVGRKTDGSVTSANILDLAP